MEKLFKSLHSCSLSILPACILLPERNFQSYSRTCLKNHFHNLHTPFCGIFFPNSIAVARYDALIRTKSSTNCDAHLSKSIFQTRSRGQVWQSSQKGNNDDALFIMQKTEMMYKIFLHGNTVNTKIY